MRGFISIDKDKGIIITASSKGVERQMDLCVLLNIAERMQGARTQKMLYGIVTQVELNTIQRVVAAFAVEAQRTVNDEGAASDAAEAERLTAIGERRERLETRKKKEKTKLRRRVSKGESA